MAGVRRGDWWFLVLTLASAASPPPETVAFVKTLKGEKLGRQGIPTVTCAQNRRRRPPNLVPGLLRGFGLSVGRCAIDTPGTAIASYPGAVHDPGISARPGRQIEAERTGDPLTVPPFRR